jgi:hypothetical protein
MNPFVFVSSFLSSISTPSRPSLLLVDPVEIDTVKQIRVGRLPPALKSLTMECAMEHVASLSLSRLNAYLRLHSSTDPTYYSDYAPDDTRFRDSRRFRVNPTGTVDRASLDNFGDKYWTHTCTLTRGDIFDLELPVYFTT